MKLTYFSQADQKKQKEDSITKIRNEREAITTKLTEIKGMTMGIL